MSGADGAGDRVWCAASELRTATPRSDEQMTQPYRASVCASADTWRRSAVTLKVVVRPAAVAGSLVTNTSSNHGCDRYGWGDSSVRDDGKITAAVSGDVAGSTTKGTSGTRGNKGGGGGNGTVVTAVSGNGDVGDIVASKLVLCGVGTPTSVKLRVTGPVNDVHWVSLSRMGDGAEVNATPTFFYRDERVDVPSGGDGVTVGSVSMQFRLMNTGYESPPRASTVSSSEAEGRTPQSTLQRPTPSNASWGSSGDGGTEDIGGEGKEGHDAGSMPRPPAVSINPKRQLLFHEADGEEEEEGEAAGNMRELHPISLSHVADVAAEVTAARAAAAVQLFTATPVIGDDGGGDSDAGDEDEDGDDSWTVSSSDDMDAHVTSPLQRAMQTPPRTHPHAREWQAAAATAAAMRDHYMNNSSRSASGHIGTVSHHGHNNNDGSSDDGGNDDGDGDGDGNGDDVVTFPPSTPDRATATLSESRPVLTARRCLLAATRAWAEVAASSRDARDDLEVNPTPSALNPQP